MKSEQDNIKVNNIYNEDCKTGLRNLPDRCVRCCVTSPPYYGLRDYGTATWKGGDTECDHLQATGQRKDVGRAQVNGFHGSAKVSDLQDKPWRNVCGKCGAVRIDDQIGIEETPEQYIASMVEVFREVKRVLADDGTLWVNIGDSYNGYKGNAVNTHNGSDYAGHRAQPTRRSGFGLECGDAKPKDLIGIPWMLAFALRADGWYLRQDIIWSKPNPMPESVTDRFCKSHEYIFLLSKSPKYYFDVEAIKEKGVIPAGTKAGKGGEERRAQAGVNGRNPEYKIYDGMRIKRDVWTVNTKPFSEAHFAVFPEKLIVDCIKAGCPEHGIVLDPFMGSGTTACVARKLNRNFIGFELNPEYIAIAEKRLYNELGMFL